MNNLTKKLIDFGLSEKEAKVYLATLELEVASVNEISKQSGINRSSTYVVLEALKKRGLIGISDDKNIRKYIAASPDTLLHSAQSAAKKQEDIRSEIEGIVPELRALYKDVKHKPIVKIYQGKEGLISSFEDTLHCKEKLMRVSSSPGDLEKILPGYLLEYVKRRLQLGIKMYGIHPDDDLHRWYIKNSPESSDKYVLISREKYKFSADIAIYDDKVGLMSAQNGGISIGIQSKVIAEVMKSIFDLAYKEAARSGTEIEKSSKSTKSASTKKQSKERN